MIKNTKTILFAGVMAAMLLSLSSVGLISAQTEYNPTLSFVSIVNHKCLDVEGNDNSDGANLIMWDCHGEDNQQWTLSESGEVISELNGKCLDATSSGNVVLWRCHGMDNQKWYVSSYYGQMTTDNGNLCLDIADMNLSSGANVIAWPCNDGLNQKWYTYQSDIEHPPDDEIHPPTDDRQ